VKERFLSNLYFGAVSVVACQLSKMFRLPFEQDRRVGFRLKKYDKAEHKTRDDEGDPLNPSPRE